MIPVNAEERRAPAIKFVVLYMISIALVVVVLSSFWQPLPSVAMPKPEMSAGAAAQDRNMLLNISILHEKFSNLQLQEQRGLTPAEELTAAENSFKRTMDSIEIKSTGYSSVNKKRLYDVLNTFNHALKQKIRTDSLSLADYHNNKPAKEIAKESQVIELQNQLNLVKANGSRQLDAVERELQTKSGALNDLQNQLKANINIVSANRQALANAQQELQVKNNRITELEKQLKSRPNSIAVNQQSIADVKNELQNKINRINELEKQLRKTTPSPSSGISAKELAKLKSDNKYLSLALTSQFQQTTAAVQANKTLKAELERLKRN